ncbi:MAG TPA: chromate resistance protein ChrB domain-containing protein [Candidatus Dormibacteraeota bacterium]
MHYVTRERIHVDRIATAWAIRRFVDPEATFGFIPRNVEVSAVDGIPFDLRGAELGHRRGRCTLDALIETYELADEGLRRMAAIVRGADLPHEDTTPLESPGVLALFTGVRDGCSTDEERLERGSVVCEALHAYCAQTREAGLRS